MNLRITNDSQGHASVKRNSGQLSFTRSSKNRQKWRTKYIYVPTHPLSRCTKRTFICFCIFQLRVISYIRSVRNLILIFRVHVQFIVEIDFELKSYGVIMLLLPRWNLKKTMQTNFCWNVCEVSIPLLHCFNNSSENGGAEKTQRLDWVEKQPEDRSSGSRNPVDDCRSFVHQH